MAHENSDAALIEEDSEQGGSPPRATDESSDGGSAEASSPNDKESAERMARLRGAAIRLDTNPRGVAAARRLRNRLPGDSKFGDPLSTAGRAPVEVIARSVNTLRGDPDSFVKEVGLAGLQLWQSLSEATGRGRGDREMALVFTDLVGFSTWALGAGDEAALELLRGVGRGVEKAILDKRGRIVKRLGDGLMASFMDARDAVDAVLEACAAVEEVEVMGYRPHMRAGVHWGRPRKLGGDYLGVDVNVAARVAEAAKGDQVLISSAVLEHMDTDALKLGRPKRLKAEGTPHDLQVITVARA